MTYVVPDIVENEKTVGFTLDNIERMHVFYKSLLNYFHRNLTA